MQDSMQRVKQFILDKYLPGEDPDQLTGTTPLLRSGILDSISTLEVVDFIESEFDLELSPQDVERLSSLDAIAALIAEKRAS